MNERLLNQLKAKKADGMDKLSAMATKFADPQAKISDEDSQAYLDLKNEIKTLSATIADAESTIAETEQTEAVANEPKNSAVAKFIKNVVRNIDRSGAAVVVPTELEKAIRHEIEEISILRKIAKVVSITSKDKTIPVEGDDVQGYWTDEGADFTEDDTTIASKVLKPYKNGVLVKVTTELLEDAAVDVETYLAKKIAKGLRKNFETTALTNIVDNDKKPLGLIAQAAVGVTTIGGADVLAPEDITSLYYSVKQAHRQNGTWLVSPAAIKEIINMVDSNGNRIYYPSFVPNVPDTILGKPVYEVDELGSTLAVGTFPVIFGDFSQLEIGERKGITIDRLSEMYRIAGKIGFIAEERIDSVLIFENAIKTLTIGAIPEGE